MEKLVKELEEVLEKLIDADGPWIDKKAAINAHCDKTALNEFLSWFDDEEQD